LFPILDIDDVITTLAQLFSSKLPILIAPAPHQPQRLSSVDIWTKNFADKLYTAQETEVLASTLITALSAVVVVPLPYGKIKPQFMRLPRYDVAMVQRADSSDHVRNLAQSVKLCYARQLAPAQTTVFGPGSHKSVRDKMSINVIFTDKYRKYMHTVFTPNTACYMRVS